MRKIFLAVGLVSLLAGVANAQDKLLPPEGEDLPGVPGACAIPGNLIQNCGFETGTPAPWALFDPTGFTAVSSNPVYAHTGNWGLFSGPVELLGSVSQTIPTTVGGGYMFSFWLRNGAPVGGTPNQWRVSFGGQVLAGATDAPDFGYTQFTYCTMASGLTTEVKFEFRQDPSFFGLDDVVVIGG